MIESKKINIIVALAAILALLAGLWMVQWSKVQQSDPNYTSQTTPSYAQEIFGQEIISIEILADEEEWQQMLDNAIKEEFVQADVIVNGTKFQSVGVRPKGNSSLTQVASSDSDRYSFRLQFDQYIKGQTCFGLESFVINNMIGDNTYLKEYISYDLMKEIGVDAPYFGFADTKVNGEDWGLYLAVELYNDSYQQRVYGNQAGKLYNVKSMDMGGGAPSNEGGAPPNQGEALAKEGGTTTDRQADQAEGQAGGGRGMGGPGKSSGGSLEYTDDQIESYSAIFDNVVGKEDDASAQRVIKALEKLSLGEDLEEYLELDQILRYLAAHTIVVNLDSYSSNMAQNYYIYEKDGKINVLPWDYNLAWGGMQGGDAANVVNFPIDTPLSGVEMEERPLINQLLSNEEYKERYHAYLQELMDNYFNNGKFQEKILSLDKIIDQYVKKDPTAFCSYEDYKKAILAFIELGDLRAQSIQGQLDGTIASTTEEQRQDPSQLIQTSLSLKDLGSMMGDRGAQREEGQTKPEGVGGPPAEAGQTKPADAGQTRPDNIGGPPPEEGQTRPEGIGGPPASQTSNSQGVTAEIGISAGLLVLAIIFAAKYRKRY